MMMMPQHMQQLQPQGAGAPQPPPQPQLQQPGQLQAPTQQQQQQQEAPAPGAENNGDKAQRALIDQQEEQRRFMLFNNPAAMGMMQAAQMHHAHHQPMAVVHHQQQPPNQMAQPGQPQHPQYTILQAPSPGFVMPTPGVHHPHTMMAAPNFFVPAHAAHMLAANPTAYHHHPQAAMAQMAAPPGGGYVQAQMPTMMQVPAGTAPPQGHYVTKMPDLTTAKDSTGVTMVMPRFNGFGTNTVAAPASTSGSSKRNGMEGQPVRPLSAYNFFFSDERENVLKDAEREAAEADAAVAAGNEGGEDGKEDDEKKDGEPAKERTLKATVPEEEESFENKKKRLLEQHVKKDRTKRRPHRKTHGKIGFTDLSKIVGKRWKDLPEEKKQIYREIASADLERYQKQVAEFNNDRLTKRQKVS
jgi:hypothetical protein